MVSESS